MTTPTETDQPWYLPTGDEVEIFRAAYTSRLPVLLKGPTGCGKTRFVEYMASQLHTTAPLVTVACHEDLTATDLVGRYLLRNDETIWMDGPLTQAARTGAICYLDEIVEARTDTTVAIHSLTDHRRILPIEKTGELLQAHPDFLLTVSYNPGYQSVFKNLKPSTRQRFVSLEFTYPDIPTETTIITAEAICDPETAERLATIGTKSRNLDEAGIEGGVSTRLLIYAAKLIVDGIAPRRACDVALVNSMSDDPDLQLAVRDIVDVVFP